MTTFLPDSFDNPNWKPYEVKFIINEPSDRELARLIADVNVLIHTIKYGRLNDLGEREVEYVVVSYIYTEKDNLIKELAENIGEWYVTRY